MVDWMIEVLTSYKTTTQTFFLAISIMDRFLAKCARSQSMNELHVIGVVSMFMACKYEEIYPIRL